MLLAFWECLSHSWKVSMHACTYMHTLMLMRFLEPNLPWRAVGCCLQESLHIHTYIHTYIYTYKSSSEMLSPQESAEQCLQESMSLLCESVYIYIYIYIYTYTSPCMYTCMWLYTYARKWGSMDVHEQEDMTRYTSSKRSYAFMHVSVYVMWKCRSLY